MSEGKLRDDAEYKTNFINYMATSHKGVRDLTQGRSVCHFIIDQIFEEFEQTWNFTFYNDAIAKAANCALRHVFCHC